MVGGEKRWIPLNNWGQGRVTLELPVQKCPDFFSAPALRVAEIGVQREIALVKIMGEELSALQAEPGEIKEGQVAKGYGFLVGNAKVQGIPRLGAGFLGGAKE